MEVILNYIQKYGVDTVVICILILIIMWLMKLVTKFVNNIEKHLDAIDKDLAGISSNQKVIVEFIKAFMFPSNPQSAKEPKEEMK
jgi:hypothetical protein